MRVLLPSLISKQMSPHVSNKTTTKTQQQQQQQTSRAVQNSL